MAKHTVIGDKDKLKNKKQKKAEKKDKMGIHFLGLLSRANVRKYAKETLKDRPKAEVEFLVDLAVVSWMNSRD